MIFFYISGQVPFRICRPLGNQMKIFNNNKKELQEYNGNAIHTSAMLLVTDTTNNIYIFTL
jgi:hypothetical protein